RDGRHARATDADEMGFGFVGLCRFTHGGSANRLRDHESVVPKRAMAQAYFTAPAVMPLMM
ncbi:MAG: hypothetical protein MUC58_11220, partial [Rhizobiaceae bacterium]|nr:hypothetical protein [Rhizobiaceae bacterium]